MNANHELTAHVVDADALLYMCHLPFSKLFQNKMNKILFEVCTFFKYAWRRSSWDTQHLIKILQTKHELQSIQQIHVGNAMFWGTGSTGKALPANSKPPVPSCKVNSQDIETQPLPTVCCTGMYLPKGIAKEQGHDKKTYKVFSLNPLYQFKEDH